MRLYSRTGATAVQDGGTLYKPEQDGGFELPEILGERLHGSGLGGRKQWETGIERQERLIEEEYQRRKDPATLLDAVEKIVKAAQASAATPVKEPAPEPEPEPEGEPEPDAPSKGTGRGRAGTKTAAK